MGKVFISGKMEGNMQEGIRTIKKMDMEDIIGMMVEYSKDNGQMAEEMGKELFITQMEVKSREFGKMIKELNKNLNKSKTLKLLE